MLRADGMKYMGFAKDSVKKTATNTVNYTPYHNTPEFSF